MRINFLISFFFVVIQYGFCIEMNKGGDECLLRNGENGTCKIAFNCQHIKKEKIHEKYWDFCEPEDGIPVICCADKTQNEIIWDCDEAKELFNEATFNKFKETFDKCNGTTISPKTSSSDFSFDRIFYTDEDCKALNDEYKIIMDLNHHESIAHGTEVEWGEFPFMVYLNLTSTNERCGGVIITRRHILTAAHCVKNKDEKKRVVRYNTIQLDDVHIDVNVSRVTLHPGYHPLRTPAGNDIAVLLLADDIQIGIQAFPACLYHGKEELRIESNATVIGFGLTHDEMPANKLMKASINIKNPDACEKDLYQVRYYDAIKEHQLCAGDSRNISDSCKGDSGGPLIQTLDGNEWMTVIGLTSFGQGGCASTVVPSVYTRVSHFIEWIERVVRRDLNPSNTTETPLTLGTVLELK